MLEGCDLGIEEARGNAANNYDEMPIEIKSTLVVDVPCYALWVAAVLDPGSYKRLRGFALCSLRFEHVLATELLTVSLCLKYLWEHA